MALDCKITKGHGLSCTSTGGIKEVYIGNWEKTNLTFDPTSDIVVTGVSPVSGSGPIDIYRVEQKVEMAGVSGDGVHNTDNDTYHQVDNLTITASVLTSDVLAFLKMLKRSNSFAIIRSNMDQLYLLGAEIPGRATESTQGVGTAFEDRNGGTITLEYKSLNGMYLLDENALGTDFNIIEPSGYKVPSINGLTPNNGSVGDTIIIDGTGFTGATSVTFDGIDADNISYDSDTQISADVPTGPTGTIDVIVTTPAGSDTVSFTVN